MSTARDSILQAVRRGRGPALPRAVLPPAPVNQNTINRDTIGSFIAKAKASIARVHEIAAAEEAPAAIWALLAEVQAPPRLHLPLHSPLRALPWQRAPGLTLSAEAPDSEGTALSAAAHGIAETGTLVFFSGPSHPSSWHFLPGREIVWLAAAAILPRLEDVLAALPQGQMPATLNLVTGPSRTGDIEQTMELGAHGPRELHILLVR